MKMTIGHLVASCLGFAPSALAQINASELASNLRAKYGPPLAREVFRVPPGEMVVDYAPSGHVCKIQLPPMGKDRAQPGVESIQAIDDFLLELLPLTMRGKELRRMTIISGLPSVSIVEYENLVISESMQGKERTGMTVTFQHEPCQQTNP